MTSRDSYVTTADPEQCISLHVPAFEELWFKQQMLEDADTMSYNHAYGGTISFPREKWSAWYDRWIRNPEGRRFYRYLKNRNDEFVGECAWHYDEDRDIFLADVLIYAPVRGKGYGSGGLELLCSTARRSGIRELYDEIGADNPAIRLFLAHGFTEVYRADTYVMVKKDL